MMIVMDLVIVVIVLCECATIASNFESNGLSRWSSVL